MDVLDELTEEAVSRHFDVEDATGLAACLTELTELMQADWPHGYGTPPRTPALPR